MAHAVTHTTFSSSGSYSKDTTIFRKTHGSLYPNSCDQSIFAVAGRICCRRAVYVQERAGATQRPITQTGEMADRRRLYPRRSSTRRRSVECMIFTTPDKKPDCLFITRIVIDFHPFVLEYEFRRKVKLHKPATMALARNRTSCCRDNNTASLGFPQSRERTAAVSV